MNCTPFATTFFRGFISLRWAQHKRRLKRATPIMWSKFKTFLWKDLESSQAFIKSIWSKFRRDFQYQLEEARDWASHLKHLQSILSEFNPIWTTNELTMICYFWKGLKPFIKIEMEYQNRETMDFEEMMQRAVNAEAKAGLKSSTMDQNSDVHWPRGHRPSHNTSSKVQTQSFSYKDSASSKEPKLKDLKPALLRDNAAKLAKKEDRKEKKKRL